MSSSDGQSAGKSMKGKAATGVVIAILVGVYSFAQPIINEKYGLNLPSIRGEQAAVVAPKPDSDSDSDSKSPQASAQTSSDSSAKKRTTNGGSTEPNLDAVNDDLVYGLLRETSPKRYLSPSGLQYTPGSAEGHRLDHLKRHTEDQPGRPGKHGVFDGGMEGALKTIDRAYDKAIQNQRTTKSVEDGRTIYTVDMGSRVGYIGGRDGNQKRKPMARRVRVVLEGMRVITAYPM